MEVVGGEEAVGLGLAEGGPFTAHRMSARGWAEAGGAKDAADGGRADLVTEAVEFVVDAPEAPAGVLGAEPDDQVALWEGLRRPAGSGAVRVWPARGRERHTVRIALLSPAGEALFDFPVAALESFLTRAHAAVPPGTESDHLDLDGQLAHILAAN